MANCIADPDHNPREMFDKMWGDIKNIMEQNYPDFADKIHDKLYNIYAEIKPNAAYHDPAVDSLVFTLSFGKVVASFRIYQVANGGFAINNGKVDATLSLTIGDGFETVCIPGVSLLNVDAIVMVMKYTIGIMHITNPHVTSELVFAIHNYI